MQPGELFLFKLHSPNNVIVGGGLFGHASIVPLSLAWEAFGLCCKPCCRLPGMGPSVSTAVEFQAMAAVQ